MGQTFVRRTTLALAGATLLLLAGCGVPNQTTMAASASSNAGTAGNAASASLARNSPLVGKRAPIVELETLNQQSTVSLALYIGKQPLVINVWASWCPPCQAETPDLVEVAKAYAGRVQFLGVNMTGVNDTPAKARAFVRQYGVTYPVLLDPKQAFFNAYDLMAFPTTFIVAPNGVITAAYVGKLSKSQLEAMLDQALKRA
ncbi:MAG: TlpA family protein disulfide reductase [Alicyclobacillus sp.]|nr:TlpA family protein disulfide reductase [Alicyclobacillus sp.]